MGALFEACRSIPAHEVAERAGLRLARRGSRYWACCPLHGERTASLCFFPDGRWKCFGCNAGGDAVALYAALHTLAPLEAARVLATEFGLASYEIPPARAHAQRVRRAAQNWAVDERKQLQHIAAHAQAALDGAQGAAATWGACWDNPTFVAALAARTAAQEETERLELMDAEDLLKVVNT